MRKLLIALGLWLVALAPAGAQCVAVGGVNSVPTPGVTCLNEPSVDSFAAVAIGLVPGSAATDIACITGPPTGVARLQRVRISGSAGTLVSVPISLLVRTPVDTAGTPATGSALPVPRVLDPSDNNPGVTGISWTANPTVNDATVRIIAAGVATFAATSAVGGNDLIFNWMDRAFIEAPTLRSATRQICVNLNGVSVSSGVLNVGFEWTESPQ